MKNRNNDMVATSLLTAALTLAGATAGVMWYRLGAISHRVSQLDTGVRIVAEQTQLDYKMMQEHLHENLQQMAEIIYNNLPQNQDGNDESIGGNS